MKVSQEALVSLCKRRGFIYQGSDLYGGLAGTWDYGPLGVELKRRMQNLWWSTFVEGREEIYGIDSSILMNAKVWQASGHTTSFSDLLVEDLKTKERFRADHLLESLGYDVNGLGKEEISQIFERENITSPAGNSLSDPKEFNMMFDTKIGSTGTDTTYLRPETAQGMFVNFKNVVDSLQPDLPFGLAQIGKAFRNEISPRDFVFRSREFEQMEIEYFCDPKDWQKYFEAWQADFEKWFSLIGIDKQKVRIKEIGEGERAHYSQRTIDFEFEFTFGWGELYGLAYRGDYDLKNHQEKSGKNLQYISKENQKKMLPHCIEPTFGVDRTILAILTACLRFDDEHQRTYLALPEELAPVLYCVSPLLKNNPELVKVAREVYESLRKKYGRVVWDDNANIGKRYRRQDEIGTPWCVVVDFETLKDKTVTVRYRDDLKQVRRPWSQI